MLTRIDDAHNGLITISEFEKHFDDEAAPNTAMTLLLKQPPSLVLKPCACPQAVVTVASLSGRSQIRSVFE